MTRSNNADLNLRSSSRLLRIDRRTASIAIAVLQLLMYEAEIDVLIDQVQQVVFGNLTFQTEVVEQRFGTSVPTHHQC